MEESEAEKMKLKYGSAYTETSEIDNSLMLPIDTDRKVESKKFVEIVESRLEEIIENAWYQVPQEYADKLLGGIILTGGGSRMKNIEKAFANHTHIEKIRVAKFVNATVNSNNSEINAKNGTLNTVLGLLIKGDVSCAGDELQEGLFADLQPTASVEPRTRARQATQTPTGVVRTEAEKQQAEEEQRKKQEEEERLNREKAEEEARIAAEKKKENSIWRRISRGTKKFVERIVSDEE